MVKVRLIKNNITETINCDRGNTAVITCCLSLNVQKSKSLVIGSYQTISTVDFNAKFTLNTQQLDFVTTYNYLGMHLDRNMSLTTLLTKLKSRVVNKIYSSVKIHNMMNVECALSIYKQTILPVLDYTGFLLIACNIRNRSDLQISFLSSFILTWTFIQY